MNAIMSLGGVVKRQKMMSMVFLGARQSLGLGWFWPRPGISMGAGSMLPRYSTLLHTSRYPTVHRCPRASGR